MSTITPQRQASDGKAEATGKGGKNKIIIILVVVLVAAAGAYFTVLKPKPATAEAKPEPGEVLKLDPVTLNLDGGHYLKLTLALQFTTAASGGGESAPKLDGSRAMDLAIQQLSNKKVAELNANSTREAAKQKLRKSIEDAYEHKVMDIYFTEFVMQ